MSFTPSTGEPQQNRGKSASFAFLLSLLVPGLGQAYSGHIQRGVLLFLFTIGMPFVYFNFLLDSLPAGPFAVLFGFALRAGLQLVAAIDASRAARQPAGGLPALAVLLLVALYGTNGYWLNRSGLRNVLNLPLQYYYIPAESSLPTLLVGDTALVNTRYHNYQRGDLVVLKPPPEDMANVVKRIVAVGGDLVSIRDGKLLLNGQAVDEPYLLTNAGLDFPPFRVPPDQFFVLGDNRNNSYDSRFWGSVPRAHLRGKLTRIISSRDRSRIGREL